MTDVAKFNWEHFALKRESDDTLAYWVLAPKNGTQLCSFKAEDLEGEMSFQYDVEDQASVGDDDCIGNPEFFNSRFYPIAPIQLALQWSPLPYLSSLLGSPSYLDVHEGYGDTVLAVWPKRDLQTAPSVGLFSSKINKFERRCYELVREVFKECNEIGVVVTVGWDYSSRKLPRVARSALKIHGFRSITRAP